MSLFLYQSHHSE